MLHDVSANVKVQFVVSIIETTLKMCLCHQVFKKHLISLEKKNKSTTTTTTRTMHCMCEFWSEAVHNDKMAFWCDIQ